MLIGLGKDMTYIYFGFTRSKVKVTMFLFLNTYHTTIIFYMLIGLGEDMIHIDFGFTRLNVKVTRVTCKNVNMVAARVRVMLFV